MTSKPRLFNNDFYYHVYNCGVEKRNIFLSDGDYQRFVDTARYYTHAQNLSYTRFQESSPAAQDLYLSLNPKGSETQRVKILTFCLMPNHFHFLLKPIGSDGISLFIADISNSHTKYFNTKNKRIGSLLQGTFKSKEITGEPSLLQVSRYIHLNPAYPQTYPYSSYHVWLSPKQNTVLDSEELDRWLQYAGGSDKYKEFVEAKSNANAAGGIEDLILE